MEFRIAKAEFLRVRGASRSCAISVPVASGRTCTSGDRSSYAAASARSAPAPGIALDRRIDEHAAISPRAAPRAASAAAPSRVGARNDPFDACRPRRRCQIALRSARSISSSTAMCDPGETASHTPGSAPGCPRDATSAAGSRAAARRGYRGARRLATPCPRTWQMLNLDSGVAQSPRTSRAGVAPEATNPGAVQFGASTSDGCLVTPSQLRLPVARRRGQGRAQPAAGGASAATRP